MATLEDLIQAAIDRDGKTGGETLVVANDLAQKITWGCRGGNVEFYPVQDDYQETRRKFINSTFKFNRLNLYLKHIWTLFLTKGEICFYVRPTDAGQYEIHWFSGGETDPDPEFKAYYKPGGKELETVVLCYPYRIRSALGQEETRWVRLRITSTTIERGDFNIKPQFNDASPEQLFGANAEVIPNELGFVPCVICANNPRRPGMPGTSDYHWLRNQVERHDDLLQTIHRNLKLFANPSLVTTRSRAEILEASSGDLYRPTVTSQSGFSAPGYPSTRKTDPVNRSFLDGGERIASVISGVSPEERFGFISADAVSGDQNLIQKELREQVHYALGGVDPLGINSGATAFEVRTLSGRVENTADEKAMALYTYGLCLVFEMILAAEERVFKNSLAYLMVQQDPKMLGLTGDQIADNTVIEMINTGTLPAGVIGLPPLGDRSIEWRYTRRVFADSSRETLDQSIVVRNLREDGVSTETCMKYLFPDKTKKELEGMLTGFSPRIIQNSMQGFQSLMDMYNQMMQIADPLDPTGTQPWAVRLGIEAMIESAVTTLKKELSYGSPSFDPADPNGPGTQPYEYNPGSVMQQTALTPDGQPPPETVAPASIHAAQFDPRDPVTAALAAGFSPFPSPIIQQNVSATAVPASSNALPSPGTTINAASYRRSTTGAIQPNGAANAYASVRAGGVPTDLNADPGLFAALYGVYPEQLQSGNGSSDGAKPDKPKSGKRGKNPG